MADRSVTVQESIEAQRALFRRAEKECGLSLQVLASRHPDLNYSTLRTWAEQKKMPAAMPFWAAGALSHAGVPDHLLSCPLEAFAGHYVSDDADAEPDACLDAAALEAVQFAGEVMQARTKTGLFTPQNKARLRERAEKVGAAIRKVLRRGGRA